MSFKITDSTPIELSDLTITVEDLHQALINTNEKFALITNRTRMMDLNVFEVLDFRNFSGVIGETFTSELTKINRSLIKNVNPDGYPDCLQVSTPEMKEYYRKCMSRDFIDYKYGGLEIKNTFGTKKGNLLMGDQRIELINEKLDWKAHHQKTNNLIGLVSDYIDNMPQIVAVCFSDELVNTDWGAVQRPKEGSTMTSFSTIGKTGYEKMIKGLKICLDDPKYLKFFSNGVNGI